MKRYDSISTHDRAIQNEGDERDEIMECSNVLETGMIPDTN